MLVAPVYVALQGATLLDVGAAAMVPAHLLAIVAAWLVIAVNWARMARAAG